MPQEFKPGAGPDLARYNRQMDSTIDYLSTKFGHKPEILEANITVLKAGYHYGETTETFTTRFGSRL